MADSIPMNSHGCKGPVSSINQKMFSKLCYSRDNFKPKKKTNSSALVFDTIYSYGMSNTVTIWGKVGLNNFFYIWRPIPPSGQSHLKGSRVNNSLFTAI